MTTLTSTAHNLTPTPGESSSVESVDPDQVVEMRQVGWAGSKVVSRLRRGRSRPKLIYLDKDLTLVSAGQPHERLNIRVARLLYEVIVNLRIPILSLGQTTWRRRREDAAVEGDQTFYITNEHLVRGRKVDLRIDPPPDLAIEVVHTHKADHALEVYGRLGVPEVWVCDENRVAILIRQANGPYQEADTASPCLSCRPPRFTPRSSNRRACRILTSWTGSAAGSARSWFPEFPNLIFLQKSEPHGEVSSPLAW